MSVAPKQGIVEFGPFIGATPASSGTQGEVPAPVPAESALFLRGDGSWAAGAGGGGGGVAISAGTNSTSTGTVIFSNSNGVSFGMNTDGVITATVVPGAAAGIAALAAGTQTATSGTVVFSNSNGIAFGLSGSTRITASYTVPTVTNSSWIASDQNTSLTIAQLAFTGSNGMTLSLSTGAGGSATVIGSYTVPNVPAQTNQTEGFYAVGNTTQNSSTTLDARTVSFGGRGIVTVGYSGGTIQISATEVPQTNQTVGLYALGNTTQNSSTTLDARTISFNGLGIVTVGYSGGSVQISATEVPQTNQTLGLYASSNTTGQSSSSTFDARTLSVRGMGVASVGYSAGELIISVPSGGGAGDGVNILAAGTQTANTTGTVLFQDSNGIAFGMSNSSVITASYTVPNVPAQTNQTEGFYAVGNTTQNSSTTLDARTVSFGGRGIVTVGYQAGTIQISATEVPQTNQTVGLYALGNTTGQSSSSTFDARTISFNGLGMVTIGYSGGSVQISATQVPQTNQTLGIYALGNTTGQSSSSTYDARTLSVDGAGIVSVGWSNSTLRISATQSNQTVGLYAGGNTTGQSSSSTFDARTISFSGAGIASVGYSGGSVIISVPSGGGAGDGVVSVGMSTDGNTAGTTGTVSSGRYIFVGSGAVSLSQSLNGQSGTLTILGPATSSLVAESGISLSTNGSTITIRPEFESYWAYPQLMVSTQTQTVAQSTSVVWPLENWDLEAVSHIRFPATVSIASMASIATAANNTKTYDQRGTFNWVMYTRGIGASSQSLQSVWSTSASSRMSVAIGQNANGSQWTVSHTLTFYDTAGSTSTGFSYATTLTNVNVSTTHMTNLSGVKLWGFPHTTTIPPNRYWMAFGFSTADTTNGNASLSNMRVTWSHLGLPQPNNTWGEFGSANNASVQQQRGVGSFSTAGGGTTGSIPFSAISSSASHIIPYYTFGRIA